MGGPFWARRDEGAWSIVKGEHDDGEDAYAAARREFAEETGLPVPQGDALALGEVRQKGGKRVTVWAIESDVEAKQIKSNTFAIEWPRGSGRDGGVPRDRSRRLVRLRDGAAQARQGPGGLRRQAGERRGDARRARARLSASLRRRLPAAASRR